MKMFRIKASILFFPILFIVSGCQTTNSDSGAAIVDYDTPQIFLLSGPATQFSKKLQMTRPEFALVSADELRKKFARSIMPSNESIHTVMFVLDRRLSVGTRVNTIHEYERMGKRLGPIRFYYKISEQQNAPLIILNESRAGGQGGNIYYQLHIDGQMLKEVKFPISY